jgi:hypothetical protein
MRYTIKQFIYKKMSVKDVHSQLCSVSSKAKSADGTLYYLGFKIWMPIVIILTFFFSNTVIAQCTDSSVRPGDGFILQGWNPTCNGGTDGYIKITGITSSSTTSPNANRPYSARILTAVGGSIHPSYPTPFPIPAGSTFDIPNLPAGTYVVDIIDACGGSSADKTVTIGQPANPEFTHVSSTVVNRITEGAICGDTYVIDTRFARYGNGQVLNFYFTNNLGATYTPTNNTYTGTRTFDSFYYQETRFFEVPFSFFNNGPVTIHLASNLCSRPEATAIIPFPSTTVVLGGTGANLTVQSTVNSCLQGYGINRSLANGTAPYTATIVETANPAATALDINGNPFVFNYPAGHTWPANFTTFTGLKFGVAYTIRYTDACGKFVTETINTPSPSNAEASQAVCPGVASYSPFIDDTGVLFINLPTNQLKTFPITFTINSGPANWVSTLGETTVTALLSYPQVYTFNSLPANGFHLGSNINILNPLSDSGTTRPKQFAAGTYNITYTDACGRTNTFNATIAAGPNCLSNSTTTTLVSGCSYTNGNVDITHTITPLDKDTRSLYRMNTDGSETLVSTLTVYAPNPLKFTNVPPGTYKIRFGGVDATGKINYPGIGGVNGIPRIAGTNYIYEETVVVNPISALTFESVTACSGTVTSLGKGGQAPYKYTLLNDNGGTIIQGPQDSGTFNGLTLGTTYTVRVTDGCGRTFNQQVSAVNNLVTPTISNVVQASCSGANSIGLSNLPSGTWTLTDSFNGTVTNGSGNSYTFNNLPAGSHSFTLSNTLGCTATATVEVILFPFTLSGKDTDGDGVDNNCDLDDDNDGILDVAECNAVEKVQNGNFGTLTVANWTGWVRTGTINAWEKSSGFAAQVYNNASGTSILTQTVTGLEVNKTYNLSFRVMANASEEKENTLEFAIDGFKYYSQTATSIVAEAGANLVFITRSFSFTPSSTSAVISFTSTVTGTEVSGDDVLIRDISLLSCELDTDSDGIPDYLDLDSDNDGCVDALEGDENVTSAQLVTASGTVAVGFGSSASKQNLGNTVDTNGIPTIVNAGGAADIGGDVGQGVGISINNLINACCTNPPATGTPDGYTKTGISNLVGFTGGATGWPGNVPNGFVAIESKNKGFVITRVASSSSILAPVEGMLIYDIAAACIKLYNGTAWNCLAKACN